MEISRKDKSVYLNVKLFSPNGSIRDTEQEWAYSTKVLEISIYNTKIIKVTILKWSELFTTQSAHSKDYSNYYIVW